MSTTHSYKPMIENRRMRDPKFGYRFRAACEEARLDMRQECLAKVFHCTPATAWNWLNGEKKPGIDNAIAICARLGICTEWLLTGGGPQRPGDTHTDREYIDITDYSDDVKSSVKTLLRALEKPTIPTGSH